MSTDPRPKRWLVDVDHFLRFDSVSAHLCGLASYHAYYDNADSFFRNELGATRVARIAFDESKGIPQGWALKLAECNLIVFAGTTNYSQIYSMLTRPNYCTLPGCGITALCGWYWGRAARAVWTLWESTIRDFCGDAPTYFTGHSLGGCISLALMAMYQADPQGGTKARCGYTFGSPRLGNKTLSDLVGPCFNVQVGADIVPKLPPVSTLAPQVLTATPPMIGVMNWAPFYPHGGVVFLEPSGNMTLIGSADNLKPGTSSVEWDLIQGFGRQATTVNPLKAIKRPVQAFNESLDSHLMSNYLRLLELSIPSTGGEKPEAFEGGREIEDKLPPPLVTIERTVRPPTTPLPSTPDVQVRPIRTKTKH